jgi:hypothetical protein
MLHTALMHELMNCLSIRFQLGYKLLPNPVETSSNKSFFHHCRSSSHPYSYEKTDLATTLHIPGRG